MKNIRFAVVTLAVWGALALGAARADDGAGDAYIESYGAVPKAIDTGYTPGPDTAIWADFAFLGNNPSEQYFVYEAGTANTRGLAYFRPYINGSMSAQTRYYAFALNSSLWVSTDVPVTAGERHQILLDAYSNRVTFVSGATEKVWNLTSDRAAAYASTSIKLFSANAMSCNYAEMRLYGFKIYEKGVLVRNYVPAKRGEVIGLYETEEDRFVSDCRGGSYTGVGDLRIVDASEASDANYIESDGTAAINTGYYANGDTAWEIDFQLPVTTDSGPVLCGAYGGTCKLSSILYYNQSGNFATCLRDGTWSSTAICAADLQRRQVRVDGLCKRWIMNTNGVLQTRGALPADTTANTAAYPFAIFANAKDAYGNPSQWAKLRVFGLRIWEKGVLKRDYRPVILDGRVGLRDMVERTFVTSKGLTAGADVPSVSGWGEPAIVSLGTGSMGTGVLPTDKTRIEIDYDFGAENRLQARLYGNDALYAHPLRRSATYINGSGFVAVGYGDSVYHGIASGASPYSGRHRVIQDFKNRTFSILSGPVTNWSAVISTDEITTNFCQTSLAQITLFGSSERVGAAQPANAAKVRIFRATFYEDDVLIRDFVPARRYGVAGMLDRAGGGFYTCEGLRTEGDVAETAASGDAYAEANGGTFQYVTTPHFASERARYEVDFQLTAANQSGPVLFGGYDCSFSCILFLTGGNLQLGMADGDWGSAKVGTVAAQDLNRHTLVMDGPSRLYTLFNADGSTVAAGSVKGSRNMNNTATKPVIIFGSSTGGTSAGNGSQIPSARIYGLRVYESGKLVSDYVPRNVDGVVGFRDLVRGTFVAGEGLLGGGGIAGEKGDAYLATGDRQNRTIDTGVAITSNSCIEADFALMAHDNNPQQFVWETGSIQARMYTGGSKTNDAVYSWSCYTGSGANYTSSGASLQAGVRRHFILDSFNNRVTLETGGFTNYTGTIASTRDGTSGTLKLFGSSNQSGNFANIRLYGFKIYEKGELVRNYVPYQIGGEGTLRDLVTGAVITRADSRYKLLLSCGGSLGAANVADLAGTDDYLDLDGTAPLVLGYFAKPTTRIEADIMALPPYVDSMLLSPWETGSKPNTALWINGSGLFQFIAGDYKFAATTKYADGRRYVAVLDAPNDRVSLRQVGGATYEVTPGTTYAGTAPWPLTLAGSVKNAAGTSFEAKFTCRMRCFGVKIYESGTLVHDFAPTRTAEGVSGLLDTVGDLGFRTAASARIGGKAYTGEVTKYTVEPRDLTLDFGETGTLVAAVVGADHYEWARNGVTIDGVTGGTLSVAWRRHRKAEGFADTYTVTPIFEVEGREVRGVAKSAAVTSLPSGLLLLIR